LVSAAGKRPLQSDIEVMEDPALGPDDCLLQTNSGVVDGRLPIRLQCIEDLLAERLSTLERK
jgi:flagellar biosynthesis/type III secretory pathway protein FliH